MLDRVHFPVFDGNQKNAGISLEGAGGTVTVEMLKSNTEDQKDRGEPQTERPPRYWTFLLKEVSAAHPIITVKP